MKKKVFVLLIGGVFITGHARSVTEQQPDVHEQVMQGIEMVYLHQYSKAEKIFYKIQKSYSENPTGYLFMAALFYLRIVDEESEAEEDYFYENINNAISKAEIALAHDENDLYAYFYLGGAYGYLGMYQARKKEWISALRNGWEGVLQLKRIVEMDSTFYDAYYGLGVYDYYRSKLMELLWWLPIITDNREKGIQQLKETMERGIYSRESAACMAGKILNEERRFEESVNITKTMLQKYPDNRIFLWNLGDGYFGIKKYEDSEDCYHRILNQVLEIKDQNRIQEIKVRYVLAQLMAARGNREQSLQEYKTILSYSLNTDIKRQVSDILVNSEKIVKKNIKDTIK